MLAALCSRRRSFQQGCRACLGVFAVFFAALVAALLIRCGGHALVREAWPHCACDACGGHALVPEVRPHCACNAEGFGREVVPCRALRLIGSSRCWCRLEFLRGSLGRSRVLRLIGAWRCRCRLELPRLSLRPSRGAVAEAGAEPDPWARWRPGQQSDP